MKNHIRLKQQEVFTEEEAGIVWHPLAPSAVFAKVQSSREGLSEEQAAERLAEFGPNSLPAKKPPGIVTIFLHQFLSPLIYILLTAGSVSLFIGEATDAFFIFAVILLNAGLGTFQEWKAEQSASALQNLLQIYALVLRDGGKKRIAGEDLVPGDVVLLEEGSRIPADLRLFEAYNLTTDESLLTGESQSVAKQTERLPEHLPLSERSNMAFAGSTVSSGRGSGVVIATGLRTELGQIAKAVTLAETTKPPLLIRMEGFARQISYVALGFIGVLAAISITKGLSYAEVFFMAVALAVSAIPEGLPVAMTVALSIATTRMARRQVIVRKLTAVEALGSCTCIASDKTGTLTVNKQTVKVVGLPGGKIYAVSGEGYAGVGRVTTAEGEEPDSAEYRNLERLVKTAVLCNDATLTEQSGIWEHQGDAVDVALLALGYKMSLHPATVAAEAEILHDIPFASEHKYAARFYRQNETIEVAVKGAPEAILPFCSTMQIQTGTVPLVRDTIGDEVQALAEGGFRVIAAAHGILAEGGSAKLDEQAIPPLCFLGLIGLIDPLRPEAKQAVAKCQRAGVRVVMITGDHPATALSIARELGIAGSSSEMVTGSELEEIGSAEIPQFLERVKGATVFSRVPPLQKLVIVDALRRLGHFVAVTGDGVNDAPALRRANIGVAMGSGTDVAKDTASLIIVDDNFASIEGGVEEGRFAYDNIRKVIYLLISTGAAEITLFTLALCTGLPLPLLAVQLLWLNLVTNGIQDVALAFEGGEPGTMEKPPRHPSEKIFDRLMVQQTIVSGLAMGLTAFATWWWLIQTGWQELAARNLILLLMVLLENVHVFNCRSERISAFGIPFRRNRLLIVGVLVAQSVHQLAMHLPLMQKILRVAPVTMTQWFCMLILALSLLLIMELFKILNRCRVGKLFPRRPS